MQFNLSHGDTPMTNVILNDESLSTVVGGRRIPNLD
jgi:hypothetical protein